jgi:hypothetical protein
VSIVGVGWFLNGDFGWFLSRCFHIGYIIDNNSLNADCVHRIHAVLLENSVPVCRNIIFGWEKRQTLFGNVEIFLEMDYRENLWETSNQ